MAKKSFLILILILILLITASGCSKADGTDPVIIKYGDKAVDKNDVTRKMNSYLIKENMSIEDLSEGPDQEIWTRFKNDILFELAFRQIALEKAADLGLNDLTPDETAAVEKQYESGIATAESALFPGEIPDKYSRDYKKKITDYFNLLGYTYADYKDELKEDLIAGKVKEYYTKDITVSEEKVKEKYDFELDVQTKNVQADPASAEQQLFGSIRLYYPEGYMYVKHILISFDSASSGSAAVAYTDGRMSEYNEIVKKAMASVQSRVDEIMKKLDGGADFDALMAEYSQDTVMNGEPYKTSGTLVGPYTDIAMKEYVDALSTLDRAGEYTQPVPTFMGCYIIYCEKPMGGAVPYEEVKDELRGTLTEQQKAYEWSKLGEQWIQAAKDDGRLTMYAERL